MMMAIALGESTIAPRASWGTAWERKCGSGARDAFKTDPTRHGNIRRSNQKVRRIIITFLSPIDVYECEPSRWNEP
jgi:hypothetical protein